MKTFCSDVMNSSFVKYGFVGVVSAVADIGLLYLFYDVFFLNKYISITVAYLISMLINFVLNYKITFKSYDCSKSSLYKRILYYFASAFFAYLITVSIIGYATSFGVLIYFAKIISMLAVYIYGYFVGKHIVFSNKAMAAQTEQIL